MSLQYLYPEVYIRSIRKRDVTNPVVCNQFSQRRLIMHNLNNSRWVNYSLKRNNIVTYEMTSFVNEYIVEFTSSGPNLSDINLLV